MPQKPLSPRFLIAIMSRIGIVVPERGKRLNNRFHSKFVVCLMILGFFFTAQGFAAVTYYVDSVNGNDSNSGTSPQTAWRTIGHVNSNWRLFAKGDDLLFKRGTTLTDATLSIQQGGTDSDPTVIGAYGDGNKPVIDCGPRSLSGGIRCITAGLGYIHIQDLAIRNAVLGNESGVSIAADTLTNITISRVDVSNVGNNGIALVKVNTYVVEDCVISSCGNSGIAIIGNASSPITNGMIRNNHIHDIAQNDGITIHIGNSSADRVGPNHQLIDNVVYRCREQAFDITSGSHITLLRNESHNNGDSGILVGGCTDVLIDKHNSHDEGTIGIIVGAVQNIRIQNSIIYNASNHQLQIGNCSNIIIVHNTIVHGPRSTDSIIDIEGTASTIIFKNNIVASTQFSLPNRYVRYLGGITHASTRSDFSNNIWWRPDGGTANDNRIFYDAAKGACSLDAWSSIYNTEAGSHFTNPQFSLANPADFSIKASSPAIDLATGFMTNSDFRGTPRPQGVSADIGAYEFNTGSTFTAAAEASPMSGVVPFTVNFSGHASGGTSPYTYRWAFGDGGSSTAQNPSHTYTSAGSFTAILTVTDGGAAMASSTLNISVMASGLLSAGIVASPTSGRAPLSVAFSGSASGGAPPYSYRWNFGDGGSSTSQNPSHTYSSVANFVATLTISDSSSASASATVNISASGISVLSAGIVVYPTSGQAPLTVAFAGSASGGTPPYSYRWNFGDGGTSTLQNPTHLYSSVGSYVVILTVSGGSSAKSNPVNIVVRAAPRVVTRERATARPSLPRTPILK